MNKIFSIGHKIIGVIIVTITFLLVFLPSFEMLEFLNEYMLHYVLFLLASGLFGLVIQNKYILYISFSCAFVLTLFLKYNSNRDLKLPKPNNQPTLGVIHINLSSVTSMEALEKLNQDTFYDVISFQELTPDWNEILLEIFKKTYPFRIMDVRMDLQGKALFSKYPFVQKSSIQLQSIQALYVELNKGKEKYSLVSTYLTPPLNKKNKEANEKELKILSEALQGLSSPSFVFGELNRVYWANPIIQFRKKSLLMNSRRNVQLSFKSAYSHIFYSGDMECYHFEDVFDETNVTIGCRGLYQKKKTMTGRKKYWREK